jgi:hypothetical protein
MAEALDKQHCRLKGIAVRLATLARERNWASNAEALMA